MRFGLFQLGVHGLGQLLGDFVVGLDAGADAVQFVVQVAAGAFELAFEQYHVGVLVFVVGLQFVVAAL